MDCPHCQGRFGAHVPGCPNAGKSSEHMEVEHLRDKVERLEAENERLDAHAKEWGIKAQQAEAENERLRKKIAELQTELREAINDAARGEG